MNINRLREIHQGLISQLASETERNSLTYVLIRVIDCVMPYADQMPVDADEFTRQITDKEREARAAQSKADSELPLPKGVVRGTGGGCNRDHYVMENIMEQRLYDDSLKWATQSIASAMMLYNLRALHKPFDNDRWRLATNEAHQLSHDIWESTVDECDDDAPIGEVFAMVTHKVFQWCYSHMSR